MRRSHAVLSLLAITLLAGCLSPQARCFAGATSEYRAVWRAARTVEADLARGFALHRLESETLALSTCRVAGAPETCLVERRLWSETPVAIDVVAHQAKLAELEARLAQLRPAAMAAAAPCEYGDWATPTDDAAEASLQP